MGGEKKPLVMSDLGCADGCGRQMGAENCADGYGRRGCKGVAGNGRGEEEAAGDERPWLRGRLRTANGCGELRGWLRTAWVQRSGWKWVGRRERKGKDGKGRDRKGKEGTGRERKGKEGKGRERMGKEGKGRERMGKERKRMGKEGKGMERTAADGLVAREWLEMGGEKKPLVMSDLGCADGCGRRRSARTVVDGASATAWLEMDGEKKPLVMSERGCADGCGRQMGAENCVDGCGRRGCNGVAGNGWGEEAAGDERAWLRGRLRTANGCGELRGRLPTAWVQGGG